MAVDFQESVQSYMEVAAAPVTSWPLTFACWAKTVDVNLVEVMISVANSGLPYDRIMLWLANRTGDPVEIMKSNSSGGDYAVTTTGVTVNVPFHACGTIGAIDDLHVFINGGSEGMSGGGRTPVGIDRCAIGRLCDSTPSSYWDGDIWEAAIWNVKLTNEEIASLAKGYSPLFIRPQNLVAYWPLLGKVANQYGRDLRGDYTLTSYFTNVADHGRIIYPAAPLVTAPVVPLVPPKPMTAEASMEAILRATSSMESLLKVDGVSIANLLQAKKELCPMLSADMSMVPIMTVKSVESTP